MLLPCYSLRRLKIRCVSNPKLKIKVKRAKNWRHFDCSLLMIIRCHKGRNNMDTESDNWQSLYTADQSIWNDAHRSFWTIAHLLIGVLLSLLFSVLLASALIFPGQS